MALIPEERDCRLAIGCRIRQPENTDQGIEPLDIVVPYTTPQLTRLALKKAEELSTETPFRIRVLRMQNVPYPLDLSHPPVSLDVLREQTRQIAGELAASEITFYLTRDPQDTLLKALRTNSILVI